MKQNHPGSYEIMKNLQVVPRHSIFLSDTKWKVEAVLFDLDGVLVDSISIHREAWDSALGEMDLPPLDRRRYSEMLGRTNRDILTGYLDSQALSFPLSTQLEIIASKERFFRRLLKEGLQTTPGVIRWLEFLKKHQILCSVASSGEMVNIVTVLELLDLSDYFASIISGAHLPASKPDPMVFLLAAASVGVTPKNCMVIEDAPAGIQAAKTANMLCCALATTLSYDDLKQADLVLGDLSQGNPETLFTDQIYELLR
jgi:HAD superfamily hydrolase (TIGR01509 family)